MHDGAILGYIDLIDVQYVFWLKDNLELPVIINSANIKKAAKQTNIELWHLCMGYLGYRCLKTLKNLGSGIDFKDIALKKLCRNCQKGNQTCQSLKILMSQSIEFLGQVYSNLDGLLPQIRQSYRYYISFLEESKKLIDINLLKYKDDIQAAFKDYKALCEKQSGC